jgi:hypothetical protein
MKNGRLHNALKLYCEIMLAAINEKVSKSSELPEIVQPEFEFQNSSTYTQTYRPAFPI